MDYSVFDLFETKEVIVCVPTIWLLKKCMINPEIMYNAHLIVRFLAIDDYYNGKRKWWSVYNQMQRKRVAQKNIIPREMANNEENFKKLILSFEERGYDTNYPILVNRHFRLVNGSHRLAIAIYKEIPFVPITMNKDTINMDPEYSLNWFEENGFKDISFHIQETYKKICGKEWKVE